MQLPARTPTCTNGNATSTTAACSTATTRLAIINKVWVAQFKPRRFVRNLPSWRPQSPRPAHTATPFAVPARWGRGPASPALPGANRACMGVNSPIEFAPPVTGGGATVACHSTRSRLTVDTLIILPIDRPTTPLSSAPWPVERRAAALHCRCCASHPSTQNYRWLTRWNVQAPPDTSTTCPSPTPSDCRSCKAMRIPLATSSA